MVDRRITTNLRAPSQRDVGYYDFSDMVRDSGIDFSPRSLLGPDINGQISINGSAPGNLNVSVWMDKTKVEIEITSQLKDAGRGAMLLLFKRKTIGKGKMEHPSKLKKISRDIKLILRDTKELDATIRSFSRKVTSRIKAENKKPEVDEYYGFLRSGHTVGMSKNVGRLKIKVSEKLGKTIVTLNFASGRLKIRANKKPAIPVFNRKDVDSYLDRYMSATKKRGLASWLS